MQQALKIVVRNLTLSHAESLEIHDRVEKLEQFFDRIVACRVIVEGPGGHHRGGRYRLRVILVVPGSELAVTHTRPSDDDLGACIREAFNAMDRRLEDYVRRLRGDIKATQASPWARVVRIFPERGYGFLGVDGREIYFHRNSVVGAAFDRLQVGARVRFAERPGDEGPQASTVVLVGSSH